MGGFIAETEVSCSLQKVKNNSLLSNARVMLNVYTVEWRHQVKIGW